MATPRSWRCQETKEIVEFDDGVAPEDEEYAAKLARISESVPLRITDASGSTAGSGSGDFHQVRKPTEAALARIRVRA